MDLDPFVPVGIARQTVRFLDIFLLHCLLADSPPDTPEEIAALARNQQRTAGQGREPGLRLERGGAEVPLVEWAAELLEACAPAAAALDAVHGGAAYAEALADAGRVVADAGRAPSACVLDAMQREFDGSYVRFTRTRSVQARKYLLELPFDADIAAHFARAAEESVAAQQRIECADTQPFEAFRQAYLSADRLGLLSDR